MSPACCWSVDRDNQPVCTTRRALRRAVQNTTLVAAQVRGERAKAVAEKRRAQALVELAEHHCDEGITGSPRRGSGESGTTQATEGGARSGGNGANAQPSALPGPIADKPALPTRLDVERLHHEAVDAAKRMVECRYECRGSPIHERATTAYVDADSAFRRALYELRTEPRRLIDFLEETA